MRRPAPRSYTRRQERPENPSITFLVTIYLGPRRFENISRRLRGLKPKPLYAVQIEAYEDISQVKDDMKYCINQYIESYGMPKVTFTIRTETRASTREITYVDVIPILEPNSEQRPSIPTQTRRVEQVSTEDASTLSDGIRLPARQPSSS